VPPALGVVALLPQAAWIVAGLGRSDFATGTSWILAPAPSDAWLVLTTVFGTGGLTPRADGFAWTSPAGVAAVLVVLVGAAVLARRGRREVADAGASSSGDAGEPADLRLGLVLLGVAAATLVAAYAVSQIVHLWTLRNLIVVVPPLTWGVVWVAAALPATRAGRRAVTVTLLVATLVSLAGIARDLGRPYKTDWRGLVLYLEQVRAQDPAVTFSVFGDAPSAFLPAADQGPSDPAARGIDAHLDRHPRDVETIAGLRRLPGHQVVYFSGGVGRPDLPQVRDRIERQLNDPACRPVPIYGLIVVSCP
jgi:hypothetical protein